jgi:hypothetical protein
VGIDVDAVSGAINKYPDEVQVVMIPIPGCGAPTSRTPTIAADPTCRPAGFFHYAPSLPGQTLIQFARWLKSWQAIRKGRDKGVYVG